MSTKVAMSASFLFNPERKRGNPIAAMNNELENYFCGMLLIIVTSSQIPLIVKSANAGIRYLLTGT